MEKAVSFSVGAHTLRGFFHLPDSPNQKNPALILCHGFTGNKIGLHRLFVKAARLFCQAGYAVLRFDYSGCGESDGEHQDLTIDGQVEETIAAQRFLVSQPEVDENHIYLVGLSMGGAVATLASVLIPGLRGLVLWAPVANLSGDIRRIVGEGLCSAVEVSGKADYDGFMLGKGFLASLERNNPLAAAASYNGPVLVVHGTADEEIASANAGLYRDARRNGSNSTMVYLVAGANHTFSKTRWEQEVFQETLLWLETRGIHKIPIICSG